jgi:hypothetical protein
LHEQLAQLSGSIPFVEENVENRLYHHRLPKSTVLSFGVKSAPELPSSQHLSTSLQRLYRYFATVVRYVATSR